MLMSSKGSVDKRIFCRTPRHLGRSSPCSHLFSTVLRHGIPPTKHGPREPTSVCSLLKALTMNPRGQSRLQLVCYQRQSAARPRDCGKGLSMSPVTPSWAEYPPTCPKIANLLLSPTSSTPPARWRQQKSREPASNTFSACSKRLDFPHGRTSISLSPNLKSGPKRGILRIILLPPATWSSLRVKVRVMV